MKPVSTTRHLGNFGLGWFDLAASDGVRLTVKTDDAVIIRGTPGRSRIGQGTGSIERPCVNPRGR